MDNYWTSFWLNHAHQSRDKDHQIQVLRTLGKQPVSDEAFAAILESIFALLSPDRNANLLDLCCGNGLITHALSDKFEAVTAIDISEEFISKLMDSDRNNNITGLVSDIRTIDFPEMSFDRILCYAGIQYLSEQETLFLFKKLRRWIRDGGLVLLGDIPDATHRWRFFDSPERENAYFDALAAAQPIVGTWFDPSWLEKLSRYAGFKSSEFHSQPQTLPYQHYRFDLILKA